MPGPYIFTPTFFFFYLFEFHVCHLWAPMTSLHYMFYPSFLGFLYILSPIILLMVRCPLILSRRLRKLVSHFKWVKSVHTFILLVSIIILYGHSIYPLSMHSLPSYLLSSKKFSRLWELFGTNFLNVFELILPLHQQICWGIYTNSQPWINPKKSSRD